MPKINIYCKNTESYISVEGGSTLGEIAQAIDLGFAPVCCRVNNKTESLSLIHISEPTRPST